MRINVRKWKSIAIRSDDWELLRHLMQLETRTISDELTVVIREACERRGIDVDEVLRARQAAPSR